MTQQQKILLALYYGDATSKELGKRIGFFYVNTLSKMRKLGLVGLRGRNKDNLRYIKDLGIQLVQRDIKKLSLWEKIKLFFTNCRL